MRLEGIIYTYDEGKILRYGQHLTTINYGNKGIVVEAQIRLYWHLYKKTNLPLRYELLLRRIDWWLLERTKILFRIGLEKFMKRKNFSMKQESNSIRDKDWGEGIGSLTIR